MTQESTEDLTTQIIKNSEEIMQLLKRDNIKLEEINDYHLYPIADNDTPKLSADRLEYSLTNALFAYELVDIDEIRQIYNDIEVEKNEENIEELSFRNEKIAKRFVELTSKMSVIYREDRTRYSMQLLADIIKRLNEEKIIALDDLYNMKDQDIIDIIKKSRYKDIFNIWQKAKKVKTSKEEPKGVYFVHHGAKVRYIDPLVNGKRISKVCKEAKEMIEENLAYDMSKYVYLDFNF